MQKAGRRKGTDVWRMAVDLPPPIDKVLTLWLPPDFEQKAENTLGYVLKQDGLTWEDLVVSLMMMVFTEESGHTPRILQKSLGPLQLPQSHAADNLISSTHPRSTIALPTSPHIRLLRRTIHLDESDRALGCPDRHRGGTMGPGTKGAQPVIVFGRQWRLVHGGS